MWENDSYFKNGKFVGRVYKRKHYFWKWGYSYGFIASSKKKAMKQVEKMAK